MFSWLAHPDQRWIFIVAAVFYGARLVTWLRDKGD